jgi:predicted metalloprotease with PDZ domain
MEQIVKIPNLRTLQIRHTSISSEDLKLLYSLHRLEGLEILYTPIDDDAIDILGNLPLWGRLRVFGTKMSSDGAEKLKELLEGMDVTFGRGGFLGIGSNQDTLVISKIMDGGGAQKAGLRVQDRIISIEGKKLQRFMELRAELAKYPPGAVVKIEFERVERSLDQEEITAVTQTIEVTLGEQTDAN